MAGCSPAYGDDVSPPGLSVKLSIKRDYTLYLTGENLQASGNRFDGLQRNVPIMILNLLQYRNEVRFSLGLFQQWRDLN
jgi:hypothetical protein